MASNDKGSSKSQGFGALGIPAFASKIKFNGENINPTLMRGLIKKLGIQLQQETIVQSDQAKVQQWITDKELEFETLNDAMSAPTAKPQFSDSSQEVDDNFVSGAAMMQRWSGVTSDLALTESGERINDVRLEFLTELNEEVQTRQQADLVKRLITSKALTQDMINNPGMALERLSQALSEVGQPQTPAQQQLLVQMTTLQQVLQVIENSPEEKAFALTIFMTLAPSMKKAKARVFRGESGSVVFDGRWVTAQTPFTEHVQQLPPSGDQLKLASSIS